MAKVGNGVAGRGRARALLLAGVAMAGMAPLAARAECLVEIVDFQRVFVCTGTTESLLAADAQRVAIAPGALLGGAAAAPLVVPAGSYTDVAIDGTVDATLSAEPAVRYETNGTITVGASGQVLAAGDAIFAAAAPFVGSTPESYLVNAGLIRAGGRAIVAGDYPRSLSISNQAGGRIEGVVAITADPNWTYSFYSIVNEGAIVGTGPLAIDVPYLAAFRNSATGTIEGQVRLGFGGLDNAGRLDGRERSAFVSNGFLSNAGVVTSIGAEPTVRVSGVSNRGSILNVGAGPAIEASEYGVFLTNAAGGRIETQGPVAIFSTPGVLINDGRIVGDVRVSSVDAFDTRGTQFVQRGEIVGSVTLTDRDDSFLFDPAFVADGDGVTGSVNAGAGIDIYGFTTATSRTVEIAALPEGFERIGLAFSAERGELTLAGPVPAGVPIDVLSSNIVIASDLMGSGPGAVIGAGATTRGRIDYVGSLATDLNARPRRGAAVSAGTRNEGTIIASGGESAVALRAFTNVGFAEARDGAVLVAGRDYYNAGQVTNLGTIRLGAGSRYGEPESAGEIDLDNAGTFSAVDTALLVGADTFGYGTRVANSGVLSSEVGWAIDTRGRRADSYHATIDNAAGGLITGGLGAIVDGDAVASVVNAGRIVGSVDLGGERDSYAATGGTLEGDLRLGDGDDTLLLDVAGALGVTGLVDPGAGLDTLQLIASTSITVEARAVPGEFERTQLLVTGPELFGGAAPIAVTNRVVFASAADAPTPFGERFATAAITVEGRAGLVNEAALSASGAGASAIRVIGLFDSFRPDNGIGATNAGVITLAGGAAGMVTLGPTRAINTGTISGEGVGIAAIGGSETVVENRGRIVTSGPAIEFSGYGSNRGFASNSGELRSTGGPAIALSSDFFSFRSTTIDNLSGGVIEGGAGVAIAATNADVVITNSGRVVGDVVLGERNDRYVAAGGLIEGRLLLGGGEDRLAIEGGFGGAVATGGVDAGEGFDTAVARFTASGSVSLAGLPGFEAVEVETVGADTVATVLADAVPYNTTLRLSGDGSVVNLRDFAVTDRTAVDAGGTVRLINRALVVATSSGNGAGATGLFSSIAPLVNEGEVRAAGVGAIGVRLHGGGANTGLVVAEAGATGVVVSRGFGDFRGGATFGNLGAIRAGAEATGVVLFNFTRLDNGGAIEGAGLGVRFDGSATIVNRGAISGDEAIRVNGPAFGFATTTTIVNEAGGRIVGTGGVAIAAFDNGNSSPRLGSPAGSVALTNRGAIVGDVRLGGGNDLVVIEGGTIAGALDLGGGDDRIIAGAGGLGVSGGVTGGAGVDLVTLTFAGDAVVDANAVAGGLGGVALRAGVGTTVTLAGAPFAGTVAFEGPGAFVATGDVAAVDGRGVLLRADVLGPRGLLPVLAGDTAEVRGEFGGIIVPGRFGAGTLATSGRLSAGAGATALLVAGGEATSTGVIAAAGAGAVGARVEGEVDFNAEFLPVYSGRLVNAGEVAAESGATGVEVSNSRFENPGAVRATGDATALRVAGGDIINMGTITAEAGPALLVTNTGFFRRTRVDNRGELRSGAEVAITSERLCEFPFSCFGGMPLVIENAAGATIAGAAGAIAIDDREVSAEIINRGAIVGDVRLGGGSNTVVNLGTITGALALEGSSNALFARAGDAGVTGAITALGTDDVFGLYIDASATVTPSTRDGFERFGVFVAGATTVATIEGAPIAAPLTLSGDGAVVLRTDIVGSTGPDGPNGVEYRSSGTDGDGLALLRNEARIEAARGVVNVPVRRFENAGTIIASGTAVELEPAGSAPLVAVNTGRIESTGEGTALFIDGSAGGVTIENSGTLLAASGNALGVYTIPGAVTLTNSGLIEGRGTGDAVVRLASGDAFEFSAIPLVTVTNTGTIRAVGTDPDGFSLAAVRMGPGTLVNAAGGLIEATGDNAFGVRLFGTLLEEFCATCDEPFAQYATFDNAGTLRSAGDAVVGDFASERVINRGLIVGDTDLREGDDRFENAGTVEGSVALDGGNDRFVALGGTVSGTLDFGTGRDVLIVRDPAAVIAAGGVLAPEGADDAFGIFAEASATIELPTLDGFEEAAAEARGAGTVLTLAGGATAGRRLTLGGDGEIVVAQPIALDPTIRLFTPAIDAQQAALARLRVEGDVTARFGVFAGARLIENAATIMTVRSGIYATGVAGELRVVNSGTIVTSDTAIPASAINAFADTSVVVENLGTLRSATGDGIYASGNDESGATVLAIVNRGLIEAGSRGVFSNGNPQSLDSAERPLALSSVVNSGTIRATGDGQPLSNDLGTSVDPASAVGIGPGSVVNEAGGLIETTGSAAIAVRLGSVAVVTGACDVCDGGGQSATLVNAGTVRGAQDFLLFPDAGPYLDVLPGAIVGRAGIEVVINTGTIVGSVALGGGADRFDNRGVLDGEVRLGAGDDRFTQLLANALTRMVDGGAGDDLLVLDTTGGGVYDAARFTGFEALRVEGAGEVGLSGALGALEVAGPVTIVADASSPAVTLAGGTLVVGTGATLVAPVAGGALADTLVLVGTLDGRATLGGGDDVLRLLGGRATGGVDGGLGSDLVEFRLASDTTFSDASVGLTGFDRVATSGPGVLAFVADATLESLTLAGAGVRVADGATLATTVGADSPVVVTIDGMFLGDMALGAGDDRVTVGGTFDGTLAMGGGANTLAVGADGRLFGRAADGGRLAVLETRAGPLVPLPPVDGVCAGPCLVGTRAGVPSFTAAEVGTAPRSVLTVATTAGQDRWLDGSEVAGFDLAVTGPGTLSLTSGAFDSATVTGGLVVGAASIGTLTGGAEGQRVEVYGAVGSAALGGGDDALVLGYAGTVGRAGGGDGRDTLGFLLAADRVFDGSSATGFEVLATRGVGTLTATGVLGFDIVAVDGGFTLAAGATLAGSIAGGAGADVVSVAGAVAGGVDLGAGDDRFTLAAAATVGGAVAAGDGADSLTVDGRIAQGVDLGAGDDRLVLGGADVVAGALVGGAGTDALVFRGGAGPSLWNAGATTGFETLAVETGSIRYGGAAAFGSVAVAGGASLFGEAGSRLGGMVTVAPGATFGSAGTVAGNIAVAGTLAPGASIGTMTVEGAVAFAAGSRLLIEVAPTGADQLLVRGAVTIAGGATLELTGMRPVTPGGDLDLVVAGGGITGAFSTVLQPATIAGFLRQSADRIQLVGLFAPPADASPPVAAAVAFVNGAIVSGRAAPALIDALPLLADAAGVARAGALARLTPEPYASAARIGESHARLIADTLRPVAGSPMADGLRGFAQGIGGWRGYDASDRRGTSSADVSTGGVLGGIEFGAAGVTAAAFVGYLESTQRTGDLGARTEADGVIAGVRAAARLGGVELAALVAYDGSSARTRRDGPGGQVRSSEYDVGGWIGDASAAYRIGIGGGWALAPSVGLTYGALERGSADEGGSVFALAVERRARDRLWADAGVTLSGSLGAAGLARVLPFVELGVRESLSGGRARATAVFAGSPEAGAITVAGAPDGGTALTLGAGAAVDLTTRLRLFARYAGEFDGAGERQGVTGGLSLRF